MDPTNSIPAYLLTLFLPPLVCAAVLGLFSIGRWAIGALRP